MRNGRKGILLAKRQKIRPNKRSRPSRTTIREPNHKQTSRGEKTPRRQRRHLRRLYLDITVSRHR